MLALRIFSLLAAVAGFSYAGQVAIFPLPVWPGTSAAGIGNRYFHQINVPVAIPDAVVAASINHGFSHEGIQSLGGAGGLGHIQHAQNFEDQGKQSLDAYRTNQQYDVLSDGNHEKFLDVGHLGQQGGTVQKIHDEASHHKNQHESAKSLKAAKFGEKQGHKRGHKTKGYHNKFHKDEYHKEHRFYDDLDKSGHHNKYGKFHSDYGKHEAARKKGGTHNSGHDDKKFGKQGFSDKGHVEEEHKGHTKKGGRESYEKHFSDYAKDQGSKKGAAYAYINADKD